jgi:hypothetical protein
MNEIIKFNRFEIMQKCLTFEPVERPNFAQIQEKLTTFLEENTGFLDILNGTFLKFVISS